MNWKVILMAAAAGGLAAALHRLSRAPVPDGSLWADATDRVPPAER